MAIRQIQITPTAMSPINGLLQDDRTYFFDSNDFRQERNNFINERRYTQQDTNLGYRILNHWTENGLIEDNRSEEGKGWRKFNLVELMWLEVIKILRDYGVSLEKVKFTKQCIFEPGLNEMLFDFHEAVYRVFLARSAILVVKTNGRAFLCARRGYQSIINQPSESFITIDLNHLGERLLKIAAMPYDGAETKEPISEKEQTILEILAQPNVREVYIKRSSGELKRVESVKRLDGTQKLIELLQGFRNGQLNVKRNNGKIVFTEVREVHDL